MNECIFCKIVNKEIPADIVYEDKDFIAFKDINPQAKIHVLLITKKHVKSITDFTDKDNILLGNLILAANNIARKMKIDNSGYRLVTNSGPDSGQIVQHVHLHILGGEPLGPIA